MQSGEKRGVPARGVGPDNAHVFPAVLTGDTKLKKEGVGMLSLGGEYVSTLKHIS